MGAIVDAFDKGGPFMWPIMILAIFALAIGAERLYFIIVKSNINGKAFYAQVQKQIMNGTLEAAVRTCNEVPDAALGQVLKAGLTRANQDIKELSDAIDESVMEVFPRLDKRTAYLNKLANMATLTGLLGTIQGLIQAFDAVANLPADQKQTALAGGISTAMFTTMSGLIVAIPTILMDAIVANKTQKIKDEIELYALKTVNLIESNRRTSGAGAAANG